MIKFSHKAFIHALQSSIAIVIIGVVSAILFFSGSRIGLIGIFAFTFPAALCDAYTGFYYELGSGLLSIFSYGFISWIVWLGILYVTFFIIHGINRNKSNMISITKWLTDRDAADYPFPYQIGDRLRSPTKNIQGTVRNAKYAGPEYVGPFPYWITYYLETENGQIVKLPASELEKYFKN
ncbi:MAG: hypothetical protein KQI78_16820 [Deltaproteobacteria bacterium]|nr:hypothetical protein [Deltaproteobacteria bacterium]